MFPLGYVSNYPRLASWNSAAAAFAFMSVFAVMGCVVTYNMIFLARSRHTKSIYLYLLAFCIMRITAFALRGYTLIDTNGQDFTAYQYAQIIVSVGFMPLAEVLTFNVAKSSAIIYQLPQRKYILLRVLVAVLFLLFGACVTYYVIDFTVNKPFGAKVPDYPIDLWLREIGFNGLFLICIYTLFGSLRNAFVAHKKPHQIPVQHLPRLKTMLLIVAFQSFLMVIKLSYITYRNWRPQEFKQEFAWYALSIAPELVFMLFFMTNRWLQVFDDIFEEMDKKVSGEEELGDVGDEWMGNVEKEAAVV
ncbi:hypothetical protein HDU98_010988 [Podochytrium sp. JEL0797]|nr:hypothetical protein HDU98_010988 [Podochytrium sp. JEL0797]